MAPKAKRAYCKNEQCGKWMFEAIGGNPNRKLTDADPLPVTRRGVVITVNRKGRVGPIAVGDFEDVYAETRLWRSRQENGEELTAWPATERAYIPPPSPSTPWPLSSYTLRCSCGARYTLQPQQAITAERIPKAQPTL